MHIVMEKFFPEADEWMWNYCTYLGSGIYNGKEKLDLGVHVSSEKGNVSFAIVYGPEGGQYASGPIYFDSRFQSNWIRTFKHHNFQEHWDTYKLAKKSGYFDGMDFIIKDDEHLSRLFIKPEDEHQELAATHNFYMYHKGNRVQGFIYNFIGFLGFQTESGRYLYYDYFEIVPKEVVNEQNSLCTT